MTAVTAARLQFAFTIMFHYLFPVLTMGAGVLIAVLKTLHLLGRGEIYADAARFFARIFALTFGMGVVTGIPMEFQFGTNWARFSPNRNSPRNVDSAKKANMPSSASVSPMTPPA